MSIWTIETTRVANFCHKFTSFSIWRPICSYLVLLSVTISTIKRLSSVVPHFIFSDHSYGIFHQSMFCWVYYWWQLTERFTSVVKLIKSFKCLVSSCSVTLYKVLLWQIRSFVRIQLGCCNCSSSECMCVGWRSDIVDSECMIKWGNTWFCAYHSLSRIPFLE